MSPITFIPGSAGVILLPLMIYHSLQIVFAGMLAGWIKRKNEING